MSLGQALTLFSWVVAVALILVMLLIARFYQRSSKQGSAYHLFLVPAGLIALSTIRQLLNGDGVRTDPLGDGLLFLAGAATLVQCYWLYRQMTGRKD